MGEVVLQMQSNSFIECCARIIDGKCTRAMPRNVKFLYNNLSHDHSPIQIWNCDESNAQAKRSWEVVVLAMCGVRNVYIVMQDKMKKLVVLSCINVVGDCIPNFYISKETKQE